MEIVKRLIVVALERACSVVDYLWDWPPPFQWVARWLGCPSGLALWSSALDERWNTGIWEACDG
jgi:hypothetical protein